MKDKIKLIITTISIFYIITISILTINSISTVKNSIEISPKDFTKEFNNVKLKTMNIKNTNCKNSINKLITKSETYANKKIINLKDLYKNGSILPEYGNIIKACNISEEDKNNLSHYAINSILIYEELIQKAMFEYELNLKDIESRKIGETLVINSKINTNKYLELELINKIIEVQNEE